MRRQRIAGAGVVLALCLSGCDPVILTAAGQVAGVGIAHTLSGIIYRTFTAPLKTVEEGSVAALRDMDIKVAARETNPAGERILLARAKDRDIEILLEPLTPRTTRMRVTASNGMLKDSATATEIILQTERVLAEGLKGGER